MSKLYFYWSLEFPPLVHASNVVRHIWLSGTVWFSGISHWFRANVSYISLVSTNFSLVNFHINFPKRYFYGWKSFLIANTTHILYFFPSLFLGTFMRKQLDLSSCVLTKKTLDFRTIFVSYGLAKYRETNKGWSGTSGRRRMHRRRNNSVSEEKSCRITSHSVKFLNTATFQSTLIFVGHIKTDFGQSCPKRSSNKCFWFPFLWKYREISNKQHLPWLSSMGFLPGLHFSFKS